MQTIWVHGLGQTPSDWDETISFMDSRDDMACPDLSMFLKKENTYDELYEGFSNYCNEIDGPINLCGLSLGAVLAMNYAIDNPRKVQSLILIAPQYKMPKLLLKLQNIAFKFMPEKSFSSLGFQKKDLLTLTKSMADLDFRNHLGAIRCPLLLVIGEKDRTNLKAVKTMNEVIKHSRLQVIEFAGHEVNRDAPQRLGTVVAAFYRLYGL